VIYYYINRQLSVLVQYKADTIIISLKGDYDIDDKLLILVIGTCCLTPKSYGLVFMSYKKKLHKKITPLLY